MQLFNLCCKLNYTQSFTAFENKILKYNKYKDKWG